MLVWKLTFFATQKLREINVLANLTLQNCLFESLTGSEFRTWQKNSTLKNLGNSKIVKIAVFETGNSPNLISRQIQMVGKFFNFHTTAF